RRQIVLVELRARARRPSGRRAALNARMWTMIRHQFRVAFETMRRGDDSSNRSTPSSTFSGIGMSSRATEQRRQVTLACARVAEADYSVSVGNRVAQGATYASGLDLGCGRLRA